MGSGPLQSCVNLAFWSSVPLLPFICLAPQCHANVTGCFLCQGLCPLPLHLSATCILLQDPQKNILFFSEGLTYLSRPCAPKDPEHSVNLVTIFTTLLWCSVLWVSFPLGIPGIKHWTLQMPHKYLLNMSRTLKETAPILCWQNPCQWLLETWVKVTWDCPERGEDKTCHVIRATTGKGNQESVQKRTGSGVLFCLLFWEDTNMQ